MVERHAGRVVVTIELPEGLLDREQLRDGIVVSVLECGDRRVRRAGDDPRLVGRRREALRAFVDTAALAGRDEVRVIHGRGTGAIRAAVRDELARHPLVGSHESDSADGATIVHLGP